MSATKQTTLWDYYSALSKKEQYKKVCDEDDCDTILDIDTPIMCYMNKNNGDKTLCRDCYVDGGYKEIDENSDNEDSDSEEEEEEEKELKTLGYRPQTRLGECAGCKSICEECEHLIITKEGVFKPEKNLLIHQGVWSIYFGAVLQDIRELN